MRILILEDNPFDVLLVKELLQNEMNGPEFYCTNNLDGYLEGLDCFAPDVVLSDNCLPQFTAVDALSILRSRSKDTPFILLTGSVSEKVAIDIIEKGATDFILKDRMARLPMAIEAACKQKKSAGVDYQYALNESAIIAITDQHGVITYVNENCCAISGYQASEIIDNNQFIMHAGYEHSGYYSKLWSTIQNGTTWHEEFLNFTKEGDPYWVDTIIIPFKDEHNQPCQYLAISNNITDRKKLEAALAEQQNNEQRKMITTALAAQENERNIIGRELHDNVNQLLVATKLMISLMIQRAGSTGVADDLLQQCNENIFVAIEENRKIARVLASPDFETETLPDQLRKLTESMLTITGLKIQIDTRFFSESMLDKQQKLGVYRILQEQCTNIVKHAFAKNVFITLQTNGPVFKMIIADDGQGITAGNEAKGIGLKNIASRVELFNGLVRTKSSPGCGFTLEIEIPLS